MATLQLRARRRSLAVVLACAALISVGSATTSSAEPPIPPSQTAAIAAAKRELAALEVRVDNAVEDYDAAQLDQVARSQADAMRSVRNARRILATEKTGAAQVLAEQRRLEKHLASVKADIERSLDRQEQLLQVLETKEARRQRLLAAKRAAEAARRARLAAEARRRAAERRAAELAARARASRRTTRVAVSTFNGPASARASVAIQEAYRQLGKPYRWGAEGPNSYDCSGLMMWAWGKAGVSLPHSSRAQFNAGFHVSDLQPGDLVFFGSPIHHVGMYVGNGQMVHAPQTGDVVKISSMQRSDYAGAVRL
jgi:cell wall-associated NlpC family hydrolase